jgi:prefoldin subunit 5
MALTWDELQEAVETLSRKLPTLQALVTQAQGDIRALQERQAATDEEVAQVFTEARKQRGAA